MTAMETATLSRLAENDATKPSPEEERKNTVEVQFNPTTLKISRQGTQSKGGVSTKDQAVQYPSVQPATMNLDLEFDTAEEYTDGEQHVDVRTRTDPLHAFLEPPPGKPAGAPPRVRFQWGKFIFQGIVTQLSSEFDYFAPDGTPLRAKVGLTIQGQDAKLEAAASGPGARTDAGSTPPGGRPATPGSSLPGAAPGRSGTGSALSSVLALAGESVQQVAARVGGAPAAWRSLMTGLASPTNLAAGTPVVIGPELRQPPGLGLSAGFQATARQSPVQTLIGPLGLGAAVPGTPAAGGPDPGFAIAAAGGIGAATRIVLASDAVRAANTAREAFDVPRGRPAASVDVPDPRALAYGRALPLRARAHVPTLDDIEAGGRRSVAARARPVEVPVAGGAVPPWEHLPPGSAGRFGADAVQRRRDGRPRRIGQSAGGCR